MISLQSEITAFSRRTTELVIYILVVLSPWAFGSVHAISRFYLTLGVAAVLLLWVVEIAVADAPLRLRAWRFQIPVVCLLAIGLFQIAPLAERLDQFAPGSAELKQQLLPADHETSADGALIQQPPLSAVGRISLYPYATWANLLWLLQLALVFVRVQTLASVDSLRRLSLVCLVNGSLLAYVAIAQFLSSAPGEILWTFASQGSAFGTFINRNHFAFYMNICIALSVGLFGSRLFHRSARGTVDLGGVDLRDTASLAIVTSLVFMCAAVVVSSSRGGLVSLLAGAAAVATAVVVRRKGASELTWITVGGSAVVLLLTWLGFDFVESRYASLWQAELTQDGRFEIWAKLAPLVARFGLLGSGLGTMRYVEPLTRISGDAPDLILNHAHNEYVQMAVEAGVLGLICALSLAGMLTHQAWRLVQSLSDRWTRLYWGPLMAVVAVTLHSFFEFGLQMPAIALLAAVVMGHIAGALPDANWGRSSRRASQGGTSSSLKPPWFRRGNLFNLGVSLSGRMAFGAFLLACISMTYGPTRQADLAERARLTALRARKERKDLEAAPAEVAQSEAAEVVQAARRRLAALELAGFAQAARLSPTDAELTYEAAAVRFNAINEPPAARSPNPEQELRRAQHDLIAARDACPLMTEAQVLIGTEVATFARADASRDYFRRARVARPADAKLAFIAGLERLEAGDHASARQGFAESLTLSSRRLKEDLLPTIAGQLTADEIEEVLQAADVDALVQAADWLVEHAQVEDTIPRDAPLDGSAFGATDVGDAAAADYARLAARLYDRALDRISPPIDGPITYTAEEHRLRGKLLGLHGDVDAACDAYRLALRRAPDNDAWRVELARLLGTIGTVDKLKEACEELRTVLRRKKNYKPARDLLVKFAHELSHAVKGRAPSGKPPDPSDTFIP